MADPQFVPLPPDAELDPLTPPISGTTQQSSPQLTPLPPNAQPDTPPQPYQGRLWPFRTDTGGSLIFDPLHTGITGAAYDALKLPGDIYTGQQQTPYSGGTSTPDPNLLSRIQNFASFFPLTSPIGNRPAPTQLQLRAEAEAGFDAARAADTTIPASVINAKAMELQKNLQTQYGSIPAIAPKTNALLDTLATPPSGMNAQANYNGLEAARRSLQAIAGEGGSDGFAAQKVIPAFDDYINTISTDAQNARSNYAALQRSIEIMGLKEKAEGSAAASGSGQNLDNRLRQTVNSFIQNTDNTRGYTPDEIAALKAFTQGSFTRDTLRTVSNILGGGGGLGRLVTSTAGAYLGHQLGLGEVGTALGASLPPTVGATLKGVQNALATRRMGLIDELIRSRSPLGQDYLNRNLQTPNTLPYQIGVPAGLLSPPQQQPAPPGQYLPLPTSGPIPAGLLGPWA